MRSTSSSAPIARNAFPGACFTTNRYLGGGGDGRFAQHPGARSCRSVSAGWNFRPAPNTYRDLWSGKIEGKIGLGIVGSESSLEPLIDSYGGDAEKIYFPYPRRWSSEGERYSFLRDFLAPQIWGSTSGESLQMLLLEFDPSHLRRLAARVATQPSLSLAAAPREAAR